MKFIEPFLFFYSLAVYIFYGIFQQILFKVTCQRKFNSTWNICSTNETLNSMAQSETSRLNLYLNIGCLFPALIVPVMCSTWGPSVGSNRLLFLPVIADTLSFGFMGLYELYSQFSNLMLVIVLSSSNIIGGYSVARALCNNYVSATTTNRTREKRFLLLEIICVIAYTFSGILGGYILYFFNIQIGIYICFGLMFLAFVFLVFVQKVEGIDADGKQATKRSKINKIRSIKNALKYIPPKNIVYITLCLVSEFLTSFAEAGAFEILVLYCLRTEFQFSPLAIGWVFSTIHAVKAAGSLVIYPLCIKKWELSGWILSLINQFLIIGYYLMLGFATTKFHIIIGSLFFIVDGSVSALISTALSDSCEGNSRGMVFGMHSTIVEIGSVIGCVFADYVYLESLNSFPGLTHLILGVFMFLGCLLATFGLYIDNQLKPRRYIHNSCSDKQNVPLTNTPKSSSEDES